MRIFFIPGLGEEISIFDKIQLFIPGEKVFIDNWTLLEQVYEKKLTALVYAQYLVQHFKIQKGDVIIGHSMGGWIALYIKQLVDCRIVQIASWTDSRKIRRAFLDRHIIYFLAKKGIGLNALVLRILVWLHYKNKSSREIFISVFKRLMRGNKEIVAKKLMIIFNPVKAPLTATADLRIHAKGDKIVKFPDEPFIVVAGDHFTLYTHPETVYEPIVKILS